VNWDREGKSASFGDGVVTLDIDVEDGPGVETTQLVNIASGALEIWVNHYTDKFTQTQVAGNPAMIYVFYSHCLDDNDQVKQGYARSVTQAAADVPSDGAEWWTEGGMFIWQPGSQRAQWTTCGSNCYVSAGTAHITSSGDGDGDGEGDGMATVVTILHTKPWQGAKPLLVGTGSRRKQRYMLQDVEDRWADAEQSLQESLDVEDSVQMNQLSSALAKQLVPAIQCPRHAANNRVGNIIENDST